MAKGKNPKLSAVAALVRRHDRDRYATALFAPAEKREHLLALYAFNYEVARIRETVREPMMGAIRLQWWRDTIEEIRRGQTPRAHEVAVPLAEAIRETGLDPAEFERILRARETDLAPAPPTTLRALETYAEETAGALNVLALRALGVLEGAEAARDLGAGYALAGLLRAAAFHARAGRPMIAPDLDPRAVAGTARARLDKAQGVFGATNPVALQAILARHWLARLERAGYDLLDPSVSAPDPWRAFRLWRAARRG
jgi:NADH dehydrogenase [ubiquinone] 1 alpha subcomplex assembly factor 6